MSMNREEAINRIENHMEVHGIGEYPHIALKEALDMAITALRPVSREQVERIRGEWVGVPNMGVYDTACSKCGYCPGIRFWDSDFCPKCGAPMTDEAVEMVMERLEALKDGL